MENAKINKIQKSSNTALIISRITKIFCITMSVLLLLAGILLVALSEKLNPILIEDAVSGGTAKEISVVLDDTFLYSLIGENNYVETMGAYCLVSGAMLICLSVIMHFICKIFSAFRKNYSPFQPKIVNDLKVTFILITIYSLLNSLLFGAVIGVALWCVMQIFEYGCELQRQSDETL